MSGCGSKEYAYVHEDSHLDYRRGWRVTVGHLRGYPRFHSRLCVPGIVPGRLAYVGARKLARRKRRDYRQRLKLPDGGWLVLDKGYQDVKFYTEFRCAENCDAGVLLRAEKTPDGGWKGVYVSLSGEGGSYDLTLNAEGKELNRTRLLQSDRAVRANGRGPLGKRER